MAWHKKKHPKLATTPKVSKPKRHTHHTTIKHKLSVHAPKRHAARKGTTHTKHTKGTAVKKHIRQKVLHRKKRAPYHLKHKRVAKTKRHYKLKSKRHYTKKRHLRITHRKKSTTKRHLTHKRRMLHKRKTSTRRHYHLKAKRHYTRKRHYRLKTKRHYGTKRHYTNRAHRRITKKKTASAQTTTTP